MGTLHPHTPSPDAAGTKSSVTSRGRREGKKAEPPSPPCVCDCHATVCFHHCQQALVSVFPETVDSSELPPRQNSLQGVITFLSFLSEKRGTPHGLRHIILRELEGRVGNGIHVCGSGFQGNVSLDTKPPS